jgi:hypothetical protein
LETMLMKSPVFIGLSIFQPLIISNAP